MDRGSESTSSAKVVLIAQLLEAGKVDTVYRDLYLERAQNLIASLLPPGQYHRLKYVSVEIDDLLRQVAPIVERQEWAKVKELTSRIRALQRTVEANHALLEIGAKLYEFPDICLNPFSQGMQSVAALSKDEPALRDALVLTLGTLEKEDTGWRDFYAQRRGYFQGLALAAPEHENRIGDVAETQRQARRALDKKDINLLERLADAAEAMVRTKSRSQVELVPPSMANPKDLSFVFSERTQSAALKLELVPAEVMPAPEFGDYLQCCCAWQAILPDRPLTSGEKRMQGCTCGHVCPPGLPQPLKETLDLLMLHPFVDSAGTRYLPRFIGEQVLVEDFPEETSTSVSDLLSALGLNRRIALSRLEIDWALLHHGPEIVQNELYLDPQQFRLVCIPFDLYTRLASTHGWGKQHLWTHFDGYQVWKGHRLRALVGGDARFGGNFDLCSISLADERESVTARFAVVRRERAAAG